MIENQQESSQRSFYTSSPSDPFTVVEVAKRCRDCGSVFITEKECESCGLQFNFDMVGQPFGPKSYFQLEEMFAGQHRFLATAMNYISNDFLSSFSTYRAYRRQLKKRHEILVHYLFESSEGTRELRKQFFYELSALTKTLLFMGLSAKDFDHILKGFEFHPFYQKIMVLIFDAEQEKSLGQSIFYRLWNYRIGLVRFGFIVALTLKVSVLSLLSLLIFALMTRYFI